MTLRIVALQDDDRADCLAQLDEVRVRQPKSLAVRKVALQVAQGDAFRKRANIYLSDALVKGLPSLYVDVRSLYSDTAKRNTILSLVEGYRDTLERTGSLQDPAEAVSDADDATTDSPTTYVWTLYFLAQHYNGLDDSARALAAIDACLAHTPSLPDFHFVRARILKRAGDRFAAQKSMEAARTLDGQDRFLNCKVAKYLCRCDRPEDAERMVGLFTRVRHCWTWCSTSLPRLRTGGGQIAARRPCRHASALVPRRAGRGLPAAGQTASRPQAVPPGRKGALRGLLHYLDLT